MKDVTRLLLYFAAVVLLGALVAPPVFWLGQFFVAHRVLPVLAHFDFQSYFHRALLIAAVALLWPLLHSLKVRRLSDLGLEKNPRAFADTFAGLLIAATPLLCCAIAVVACHVYSLRQSFLWAKMPGVILASILVPIIEELLFRGLILGVLLRASSSTTAILVTAGFFSGIHFLKAPHLAIASDAVSWFSGFISISHSFWQFGDPVLLAAGFLTLFAVGCILADARLRTNSLWLPIGLHAGWILASGTFSKAAHREVLALPWLGKDLLVGIVPLILALASWALMRCWTRYANSSGVVRRTH